MAKLTAFALVFVIVFTLSSVALATTVTKEHNSKSVFSFFKNLPFIISQQHEGCGCGGHY